MKRDEMVNKLATLISTLKDGKITISNKMFAEVVLTEVEHQGMLPPGVFIENLDKYGPLLEHEWE